MKRRADFPDVADLNVLFIGAGEMIELVATYFAAKNPKLMAVANRTLPRAQELCEKLGVNAEPHLLAELPAILHEYDVVVSSTASQLPIVGKGMVERALRQRHHIPVFMLDLAVPRDIEEEVGELNDAYLYTVDDMMGIVQQGKEARQKAAAEAEVMVSQKVAEFIDWQKSRQSVPLIRALRDEGERARRQVLENAMKQLAKARRPKKCSSAYPCNSPTSCCIPPPARSIKPVPTTAIWSRPWRKSTTSSIRGNGGENHRRKVGLPNPTYSGSS